MSDPDPLEQAALAYVTKVEGLGAEGVQRQRTNAERAWTIAGVLAAVILAAGFTTALRSAHPATQIAGVAALSLWFVAATLFMRISLTPTPRDPRLAALVASHAPKNPPTTETIQSRRDALGANVLGAAEFAAGRVRVAIRWATAASIASVVAVALTVFLGQPEERVPGMLALTPAGQDAIAVGCPSLDHRPTDIDGVTYDLVSDVRATVVISDLETESALLRIEFAPGKCALGATVVYLDRAQFIGVVDP